MNTFTFNQPHCLLNRQTDWLLLVISLLLILPTLALATHLAPDTKPKPGCEYKLLAPGYYGGEPYQDAPVIYSKNGRWQGTLMWNMPNT
jgi:hypothetical protein